MRQLFTVSHWIFYNMVTVAAPTGTCVQMRVYVLSRHCQNRRCLLYLYLYTPFTPSFPPHSLPFNSQGTIFPSCYWGECTRMVLLLLCVCAKVLSGVWGKCTLLAFCNLRTDYFLADQWALEGGICPLVGMVWEINFFQIFPLQSPAWFIFLLLLKDFIAKNNQGICLIAYKAALWPSGNKNL